ncbi:MAG TPA: hypothetical protein VEV84_12835 [Pyrinomonadaceae bacterium]|nr:hypothetical protein [Pyrinomonadaceae bacterium]
MAFVYEESFRPSDDIATNQPFLAADMNDLLKTVNVALTKVSGPPVVTSEGPLYSKVPKGLKAKHDGLKWNLAKIWEDTIISYEAEAYGASADLKELEITLGYFFTKPQPPLILEKVLMHEFLHLVVDLPKAMHHGRINYIIKHRLNLPGDPNPLGTVGLECG